MPIPFIALIIFYAVTAVIRSSVRNSGAQKRNKSFDRIRGAGQQNLEDAPKPTTSVQPADRFGRQTQRTRSAHQTGMFNQQTPDQQTQSGGSAQQAPSPFRRQANAQRVRPAQPPDSVRPVQGEKRDGLNRGWQRTLGRIAMETLPKLQDGYQKPEPSISVQIQDEIGMQPDVYNLHHDASPLHRDAAPLGGSLTLAGRQAPRVEGPTHDETIDHIYKLDDCESPAEEFLVQRKKGELSLAEGMIWSQILGMPRGRQYIIRKNAAGKKDYSNSCRR
ncbi:MAG: hypothetical protein LBH09_06905 [Peptococcaceae bacterium]|nr:hypothetical protein [Peptococcaceae bacterium]